MALNLAPMDQTHREFVDLLTAVEQALNDDPESISGRFAEFLGHTEAHFAQEERWMQRVGFAVENCHAFQHKHVLDVLREVQKVVGTTGDAQILRRLLTELAAWFPAHAQMMDQALAETIAAAGYDPLTDTLRQPPAAEAPAITGCGSSSCS